MKTMKRMKDTIMKRDSASPHELSVAYKHYRAGAAVLIPFWINVKTSGDQEIKIYEDKFYMLTDR